MEHETVCGIQTVARRARVDRSNSIQRYYIAPNAQARGSKLQGAVLETVSGVNDEQRNSDFQFLE